MSAAAPTALKRAVLTAFLILAAVISLPAPASAGTVSTYPEFPYPATDYHEPQRGQFHFSARSGWMNDVNAPLYYRGTYHLFFQHNPHGLAWDTMHWGHATSTDLTHWTQKPIALEPGVHPGDLWSGAGVVDTANVTGLKSGDDDPIVVFTGTNGVSMAYSTDGAKTFTSFDNGRKLVTMPGTSRDPKVLWHEPTKRWVMVVWSDAGGNGVNIYTSTNLIDWTLRSRYAANWLFECPDLFQLPLDGNAADKRWVLTDASGEYVVGGFDGTAFSTTWTGPQVMDHGRNSADGTFYAGLVFADMPDNRVVQMAWQPGNKGGTWTGNASIPAQLGLRTLPAGIRVTRFPVAEVSALRTGTRTWTSRTVTADPATDPLAGVSADTYELEATFEVSTATATRFGFRLHTRPDGSYDRAVSYDRASQTLDGKPLPTVNGSIKLRLLVDRGQLEIFGNDGTFSWTDNVAFDSTPTSQGIRLFAENGSVRLTTLRLHQINSTWGVGESTLDSNLAGPWRAAGGTWTDTAGGKRGSAGGDGFYLGPQTAGDASYEGDVRLDTATAAGLTFRASADGAAHYTANIDASGLVKLWRPGRDIAVYPTPIERQRTYHLKVTTNGGRIRVYLDHGPVPVIDATDTAYATGRFGANVFAGAATIQNLYSGATGFVTTVNSRWYPVGGGWTVPGAGVRGQASGDAFLLSDQVGTDFSYSGDLRVETGVAAALTFRANTDATEHYTANIDTGGVVKLWRPGRVIAEHRTTIRAGRTYHLRVVATGSSLRVYLDGGATPVIDTTDTAYPSGRFGVNVFEGSGVIQNVAVS
ncbi:levanase [Actinoplanes lobatus]|uniref:Fructan beta-fructosidase n=1 Tax=Actinoplanes lobatus TaxID=113568 RepID=A0A7W7HKZ6_9ACTN|nr:glycoside hydrolase family 32 protein [Actinoplanes lobatus]MBB4752472.1 fructan beta-fructosidase [Actinoplanes lobatus]GGN99498.1 levanase [Actinoplanes lobatus]GIE46306.1 levanase [Actinoplanes lobatus]